jgi:hypothetical protein
MSFTLHAHLNVYPRRHFCPSHLAYHQRSWRGCVQRLCPLLLGRYYKIHNPANPKGCLLPSTSTSLPSHRCCHCGGHPRHQCHLPQSAYLQRSWRDCVRRLYLLPHGRYYKLHNPANLKECLLPSMSTKSPSHRCCHCSGHPRRQLRPPRLIYPPGSSRGCAQRLCALNRFRSTMNPSNPSLSPLRHGLLLRIPNRSRMQRYHRPKLENYAPWWNLCSARCNDSVQRDSMHRRAIQRPVHECGGATTSHSTCGTTHFDTIANSHLKIPVRSRSFHLRRRSNSLSPTPVFLALEPS